MKPIRVFVSTWLFTGFGALVGSIAGNGFGPGGLHVGAGIGGVTATAIGVWLAIRLSWLPPASQAFATLGGIAGFGFAAGMTLANMGTPLVPVLSCGFVGAGVLLGAGFAAGFKRAA